MPARQAKENTQRQLGQAGDRRGGCLGDQRTGKPGKGAQQKSDRFAIVGRVDGHKLGRDGSWEPREETGQQRW